MDPTHLNTFHSEVTALNFLDMTSRCNSQAYLHCPQFGPVLEGIDGAKGAAGDAATQAADHNLAEKPGLESAGDSTRGSVKCSNP